jgi:hypothetical protein
LPNGSATTASRPTGMEDDGTRTVPPAATRRATAWATEVTSQLGRRRAWCSARARCRCPAAADRPGHVRRRATAARAPAPRVEGEAAVEVGDGQGDAVDPAQERLRSHSSPPPARTRRPGDYAEPLTIRSATSRTPPPTAGARRAWPPRPGTGPGQRRPGPTLISRHHQPPPAAPGGRRPSCAGSRKPSSRGRPPPSPGRAVVRLAAEAHHPSLQARAIPGRRRDEPVP